MILRGLASLPGGHIVYQFLQNRFGIHLNPAVIKRKLQTQAVLAEMARRRGVRLEGAHVVEVGTGWVPLVSLAFWICGARRITTFDLNSYLLIRPFARSLEWMSGHRADLAAIWGDLVTKDRLDERLSIIDRLKNRPRELLRHAHIERIAPGDASRTNLPSESVDIHCSVSVFEHIPREGLHAILREARRILRRDGTAVHRVDPTDHFAHFDRSLTNVGFLRFDEREWRRHYGNRYTYQNRLHDPDFRALFEECGFRLEECRFKVDARALDLLKEGLPVDPAFRDKNFEELCRSALTYAAVPTRS